MFSKIVPAFTSQNVHALGVPASERFGAGNLLHTHSLDDRPAHFGRRYLRSVGHAFGVDSWSDLLGSPPI